MTFIEMKPHGEMMRCNETTHQMSTNIVVNSSDTKHVCALYLCCSDLFAVLSVKLYVSS